MNKDIKPTKSEVGVYDKITTEIIDLLFILEDIELRKRLTCESYVLILTKYPNLAHYIFEINLDNIITNLINTNKEKLREVFSEEVINKLIYVEKSIY